MAAAPKGPAEREALAKFEAWVKADASKKIVSGELGSKIDPSEEQDWYSLSLGFFAALGLKNAACHRLALYARYTCHYWRP